MKLKERKCLGGCNIYTFGYIIIVLTDKNELNDNHDCKAKNEREREREREQQQKWNKSLTNMT